MSLTDDTSRFFLAPVQFGSSIILLFIHRLMIHRNDKGITSTTAVLFHTNSLIRASPRTEESQPEPARRAARQLAEHVVIKGVLVSR